MTTEDNEKGFAELFAGSEVATEKLTPGRKISATVVNIGKDSIFIDLGGKSEGVVARDEFIDSEGNPSVAVGDTIEVYFLAERRNEKLFTAKLGGGAAQGHLQEAYENEIPVEGTVEKETKGGFLVRISGSVRAFCPFSQMALRRVENNDEYLGQKFTFKIMEYREGGRNILVSRRRILEEERAQKLEELKKTLEVGGRVRGTVSAVRDFGAFVDIGGLEGLIPVSEIGWGRVKDVHSHLHPGQEVEVVVKSLDWDKERFSFSLKETLPDPWDQVPAKYPEGSTHQGTVCRLADFGAFVTLEPGIDGLVHISKLGAGRRINHPREVVKEGEVIEVRVEGFDLEQHRLSLSIPAPAGSEPGPGKGRKKQAAKPDTRRDYKEYAAKASSTSMGTFADLLKGKVDKKK